MLLANFDDAPLLRQQTREGAEIGRQSALQARGAVCRASEWSDLDAG